MTRSDRRYPASFLKNTLLRIVVMLFSLTVLPDISAQNNTLFLMPTIPQANQLNPAYMIPCRIYVELPVISSVRVNVRSTGTGFHDAIHTGTGAQSNTYYIDLDNIAGKLRKMNYGLVKSDIDLLGFGFRFREWYLTFGIANHVSVQVSYPHDIVSLKDGNFDINTMTAVPVNLNNIGVNASVWNSIGVSASKQIYEGLRVGVRMKYLNGMANINTSRTNISLNTTSDPITLDARMNYKINGSIPVNIGYGTNGLVNSINFEPALHNLTANYIFNRNRGLSIDAGIVYDVDEVTRVSASITDLGFIWWRKNTNNFTGRGNFVFQGIDLDQYALNPGQTDLITSLGDSLLNAFSASNGTRGYVTSLPVNIYGGITRQLTSDLNAGAMSWIEIDGMHLRPSLTLSLNYTPVRALAASLSYTLMNNKFNQIGAGLAIGGRGVQFYIVTDNIPVRFTKDVASPLIWPYNARMFSLRFGINLLFGCNKKEKSNGMMNRAHRPKSKTKESCPAYW